MAASAGINPSTKKCIRETFSNTVFRFCYSTNLLFCESQLCDLHCRRGRVAPEYPPRVKSALLHRRIRTVPLHPSADSLPSPATESCASGTSRSESFSPMPRRTPVHRRRKKRNSTNPGMRIMTNGREVNECYGRRASADL